IPLTEEAWSAYVTASRNRHQQRDEAARHAAGAEEANYWRRRHQWARDTLQNKPNVTVPDTSKALPVHNDIDRFIARKLEDSKVAPAPLSDDWTFLRRVTLDITGMAPTRADIDAFMSDTRPDRRARVIDRLLADR